MKDAMKKKSKRIEKVLIDQKKDIIDKYKKLVN
jgi:hypothetical protein